MSFTFIFDIGKTNIKGHVLNDRGITCWSRSRSNAVVDAGAYPHVDLEDIWTWLIDVLAEAASSHPIEAINVSSHGACAVLLDKHDELALPVLDYEFPLPEEIAADYASIRPPFADTLSPNLPVGLNLGRQLYWQRLRFPDKFVRVEKLMCYPQYWVWRLSGRAVSERSFLGCHTDLWLPRADTYSSLVDALGIRQALPPIVSATDCIGTVLPSVAADTGLSSTCRVYAGIHDSSASYARYLASEEHLGKQFTVVSTGTWFVSMANAGDCANLQESRDTLANVDVNGQPIACARFMGGREFERICNATGTSDGVDITPRALQTLVRQQVFALPSFASGGPFANQTGEILGATQEGSALATLYLALMVDYELDLLGSRGDVVFGSLSERNPTLCRVLATLRPLERILLSGDTAGTTSGAWCLTRWGEPLPDEMKRFEVALPLPVQGLSAYREHWRKLSDRRNEL